MQNPIQPPAQPAAQQPVQTPVQPMVQQPPTPPAQVPPSSPQTAAPSSPKSQKGLLIAAVLIILVIISGIGFYLMQRGSSTYIKSSSNIQPTANQTIAPTKTTDNSALPAGNSDSQLEKDAQTVNTQLDTATNDLGSVDQGLNDQPVNLSQ